MQINAKYLKPRKQTKAIRKRKQKSLEFVTQKPSPAGKIAKSKSISGNEEDKLIDCFEMMEDGEVSILSYPSKVWEVGKYIIGPPTLSQKEVEEKMNSPVINEYQPLKFLMAQLHLFNTFSKNPYAWKSTAVQELLGYYGKFAKYSRRLSKFKITKQGKDQQKIAYQYGNQSIKVLSWPILKVVENHVDYFAREKDELVFKKFCAVYRRKESLSQAVINSKKNSVTPKEKLEIINFQIYEYLDIIIRFKEFLEKHYPNTIDQKIPADIYNEYSNLLDMYFWRDTYRYKILKTGKHTLIYRIKILLNNLENTNHQTKKEFRFKSNKPIRRALSELTYRNGMPNMRAILGYWYTELPLVPLLDKTPRSLIEKLDSISREMFPEYEKSINEYTPNKKEWE